MKKTLTLFPLLSVTLLISPMLKAADFTFQPRAITGVMSHEYKHDILDMDITDTMFFLGAGATLSYDRFFVDAYIQRSGEGEDRNSTFTRKDYAIAFGYAVTDSLSISAGYRKGTTEIDLVSEINPAIKENISLTSSGPFIGAAYGWLIGDGLLGLNLAISRLSSDYQIASNTNPSYLFSGNAVAYTFGVHWKAPTIIQQLSYSVSLDSYGYNFDSESTVMTGGSNDDEIEESFLALRASLSYRF
jgi:hypothetical protein